MGQQRKLSGNLLFEKGSFYDGSRTINLVWLGRRTIGGIEPGTYVRATGRVTTMRGVPTIFNPAYEIVPLRGH